MYIRSTRFSLSPSSSLSPTRTYGVRHCQSVYHRDESIGVCMCVCAATASLLLLSIFYYIYLVVHRYIYIFDFLSSFYSYIYVHFRELGSVRILSLHETYGHFISDVSLSIFSRINYVNNYCWEFEQLFSSSIIHFCFES